MFHKEPLTSEETFLSLNNLWLNVSLWNQKWLFYGIAVKNLLSTFIFKSVPFLKVIIKFALCRMLFWRTIRYFILIHFQKYRSLFRPQTKNYWLCMRDTSFLCSVTKRWKEVENWSAGMTPSGNVFVMNEFFCPVSVNTLFCCHFWCTHSNANVV